MEDECNEAFLLVLEVFFSGGGGLEVDESKVLLVVTDVKRRGLQIINSSRNIFRGSSTPPPSFEHHNQCLCMFILCVCDEFTRR